jgi:hypothetical protein
MCAAVRPSSTILTSCCWRVRGKPVRRGLFRIASKTDNVVADVSVSVAVIGSDKASLRLYYDGRFGDTVKEHAGGIKASFSF